MEEPFPAGWEALPLRAEPSMRALAAVEPCRADPALRRRPEADLAPEEVGWAAIVEFPFQSDPPSAVLEEEEAERPLARPWSQGTRIGAEPAFPERPDCMPRSPVAPEQASRADGCSASPGNCTAVRCSSRPTSGRLHRAGKRRSRTMGPITQCSRPPLATNASCTLPPEPASSRHRLPDADFRRVPQTPPALPSFTDQQARSEKRP